MSYILISIFIMALVTFLLRYLPFIIFNKNGHPSDYILYMGRTLPPAIIGMLVIYCLKDIGFIGQHFFAPTEILAGATVIALHLWKRNILLSITLGTILNMVLQQLPY